MLSFREEDFSLLIDHCLTLRDDHQRLDLLKFMCRLISSDHEPLRNITGVFDKLIRVHALLNESTRNVTIAVIDLVISVYRHCDISEATLSEHLYIIVTIFLEGKYDEELLQDLLMLMSFHQIHHLFPVCCFIAGQLRKFGMYQEIQPSQTFAVGDFWALPAIFSIISPSQADCDLILGFVCRCSIQNAVSLFHLVRASCKSSSRGWDEMTNRFLHILCINVLNERSVMPAELVADIFDMIRFHFFMREAFVLSSAISELWSNSPFKRLLPEGEITNDYVFGLRLTPDGIWKDADIAMLYLQLVRQYRTSNSIELGLVVAAFLVNTDYDYVMKWLTQLQLSQTERQEHYNEMCLLIAKVAGIPKPFCYKAPAADVFINSFSVIETLPFSTDPRFATGHIDLNRQYEEYVNVCRDRSQTVFTRTVPSDCSVQLTNFLALTQQVAESHSRLWRRLWSNLAVENAPWDPSRVSNAKISPRWKRASHFGASFCPFLMKRNRHYTNHIEASISRDVGNKDSAEQKLKEYQAQVIADGKARALPDILEVSVSHVVKRKPKPISFGLHPVAVFECELIKIRRISRGDFEICEHSARLSLKNPNKVYTITFNDIVQILHRRRLHHPTGVEIFLTNGQSYFLNFPQSSSQEVLRFFSLKESIQVQRQDFASFFQPLGLKGLEAARVFVEIDFQQSLIDSHASFSPSKRDIPLKFEPAADQILKGVGHQTFIQDEFGLFCRSCASNCNVVTLSSANRSVW
jgi:hypothetical protein